MRIRDISESTTSGSVATVATPLGKTQSRAGKLFKGKKTSKPFYEDEVNEADLILVPGHGKKIKPGFIPKDKDRTDHEVEMARSDLFQAAKNAKKVYELIQNVSEEQGLEGWVQEKIIKANDYLNTIREYLEHKTYMQEMTGGVLAGGMSNFEEGVAEGFPQPGESSGKAKQFNSNAKIQTREMTLDQILSSVKGIPYVNDVIQDWDAKDYSWSVTKKVIEYAQYLQKNPQSVANLPPLVVIDGKLNDGAHRLSAINLLQKRMDPKNPLWKQVKLKVNFGTSADVMSDQGVAEGKCPECGGPAFSEESIAEAKDACYHKVKSRYKVWPSAYASGALVKCRKVGASNWGNKSKK